MLSRMLTLIYATVLADIGFSKWAHLQVLKGDFAAKNASTRRAQTGMLQPSHERMACRC